MLQDARIVVQAEEQRTDRIASALVPAKAGDDAVGGARELHLDHRALPRLISEAGGLGDDAVEPGALEVLEPVLRLRAVTRHGSQVNGRRCARQQLFQRRAPRALRLVHQAAAGDGQRVEGDEGRWGFLRELGDARGGGMQPELKRVEIEAVGRGDDDLAVEHAVLGQARGERVVQFREVAVERPRIAALDEEIALAFEHQRAEAVPFRLEQIVVARG